MSMMKQLIMVLGILMTFSVYAEGIHWIDVRSAKEFNQGHVDSALHIPHTKISKSTLLPKDKDAEIYVYCRSGGRAGLAKKSLKKMGYTKVTNIGGVEDAQSVFKKKK